MASRQMEEIRKKLADLNYPRANAPAQSLLFAGMERYALLEWLFFRYLIFLCFWKFIYLFCIWGSFSARKQEYKKWSCWVIQPLLWLYMGLLMLYWNPVLLHIDAKARRSFPTPVFVFFFSRLYMYCLKMFWLAMHSHHLPCTNQVKKQKLYLSVCPILLFLFSTLSCAILSPSNSNIVWFLPTWSTISYSFKYSCQC